MNNNTAQAISNIINNAQRIAIIQPENPDGDSLASALALEHILGDLGKTPLLFCPVQIPRHLRFMSGWDRVEEELPVEFDASIIVDTSSALLLERVFTPDYLPKLKAKPTIVIDHHATEPSLPYETTNYFSDTAVATGEAIYELALALEWPLNVEACEFLTHSIMFDSLGLSTDSTTARSIHIVAELVERGVKLAKLNELRRDMMKRSAEITNYKGRLIQRIEYNADGQIASVHIPWDEIHEYSDQYNPSVLVIDEMRLTEGVKVAVAYKTYPDGKITAKIRCNYGWPIAAKVAEHFGGGGHPYAAGFKVHGASFDQTKKEFIHLTRERLQEIDAAIQHENTSA